MNIIEVTEKELNEAAGLFDLYRQFYRQESDLGSAKAFLQERFLNKESVMFLVLSPKKQPVGFAQLYPAFSSVSMKKIWILNDLFVAKEARKLGVARALLQHIRDYARSSGAITVKLATAIDNIAAKNLYESEGYKKVVNFDQYTQSTQT